MLASYLRHFPWMLGQSRSFSDIGGVQPEAPMAGPKSQSERHSWPAGTARRSLRALYLFLWCEHTRLSCVAAKTLLQFWEEIIGRCCQLQCSCYQRPFFLRSSL